ncbi:hypothetical protein LCGC14_1349920 [marine sediment metagenome]|uniref:2-C-methyl-D-erythritol 2,4-cyclodiphosphate synthase n=1 Tax=marine sediment metagenome TaxID=412755 RepID=A0A0F9MS14_9ZZZZ
MRVGIGFDAHRFKEGRPLIIGGIKIEHDKGLEGHSDADVLIHALIDALLGAAALGNIGEHFPDNDPQYKDISSLLLLEKTSDLIRDKGYDIANIDAVVILEEPRLEKYREQMQSEIGNTLNISPEKINVKAKTTEKMGFTGNKEGIAVMATLMLEKV